MKVHELKEQLENIIPKRDNYAVLIEVDGFVLSVEGFDIKNGNIWLNYSMIDHNHLKSEV